MRGTFAWYLGPTRDAVRGKIKSSGSIFVVSEWLHPLVLCWSYPGYLQRLYIACERIHRGQIATSIICSHRTHPKYLKGHILKCLTGKDSSLSARLLSLRGRPRPRADGALDLPFTGPAPWRTAWLSTSSSCFREHGAQVQPYPREGFAASGGFTQRMWKWFLHRSHCTESALCVQFRWIVSHNADIDHNKTDG